MTTEDFSKGQGIGQSPVGPVPHLGHSASVLWGTLL